MNDNLEYLKIKLKELKEQFKKKRYFGIKNDINYLSLKVIKLEEEKARKNFNI